MEIKAKRAIRRNTSGSSSCSMTGVWRAVTYTKGIAVVFHGPKACAHIAQTMDIGSHFRSSARGEYEPYSETVPLVSTLLSDEHSIFGGEKQLRKCLDFVITTYQPQCIVIANSCVSGVIGDDVISTAKEVEEESEIPVIAIPCSGFLDGEFFEGYYETTKALVERFMHPQAIIEKSVVLLGDYGGPNGEYAREVRGFLKYFGLQIIGQFPSYLSLDDLNLVPASSLNLVLGGRLNAEKSVEKIGALLEKTFGTPYYAEHYPLGWENTVKWLEGLGQILGQEDAAQKAIQDQRQKRETIFLAAKEKVKQKKTVLCIGRRLKFFQPRGIIELIQSLDMDFQGVIFLDCYSEKDKKEMEEAIRQSSDITIYTECEGGELLNGCDLVFTTHELNMPQLKQLFLPMIPSVGVTGELDLIEKIVRLLYRRTQRGGIIYG